MIIQRAVLSWVLRGVGVIGVSWWYFGSMSPSTPWYFWSMLAAPLGVVLIIISLWLTKPTSTYSVDYSRPWREQGWDVSVAGDASGATPLHVLDVSEIVGQRFKPLYTAVSTAHPDIKVVIGNVVMPLGWTGDTGVIRNATPVVIGLHTLAGSIPGWINVRPTPIMEKMIRKEITLESIEFNKIFDVQGTAARLAFAVLPPDLMSWYMDLDQSVWLHLEGNQVCLVLPRLIRANEVPEFINHLESLGSMIQRGSTLEPVANKG